MAMSSKKETINEESNEKKEETTVKAQENGKNEIQEVKNEETKVTIGDKIKGVIKKTGGWLKENGKTVAVTALVTTAAIGGGLIALSKRSSDDEDDYYDDDDDVIDGEFDEINTEIEIPEE